MIMGNQGYQPEQQGYWVGGQFVLPPVRQNPRILAGRANPVNPSNVSQEGQQGGLFGQDAVGGFDANGTGTGTPTSGQSAPGISDYAKGLFGSTGIEPLDYARANPGALVANALTPTAVNLGSMLLSGKSLGANLFGSNPSPWDYATAYDRVAKDPTNTYGENAMLNSWGMRDGTTAPPPSPTPQDAAAAFDAANGAGQGGGWDYSGDGGLGTYAKGGVVRHPLMPGNPPGPDNRVIGAQDGEYVVRKKQARKHRGLLDAINSGASDQELKGLL